MKKCHNGSAAPGGKARENANYHSSQNTKNPGGVSHGVKATNIKKGDSRSKTSMRGISPSKGY